MRAAVTMLVVLLAAPAALAQAGSPPEPPREGWEYYAEVTGNFVGDGDDFATPVVMADRGRLHLEARYNYEDQDTASLWGGCNFSFPDGESWIVTPMLGVASGDTDGVAVGVELTGTWKRLDVYVEGERLFASGDEGEDFTYFWSELTLSASDWFRAGLVSQRTRAIETDVDVMRGVLAVLTFDDVYVYTSLFEPGSDDQTVVVSLGVEF